MATDGGGTDTKFFQKFYFNMEPRLNYSQVPAIARERLDAIPLISIVHHAANRFDLDDFIDNV